MLWISSEWADHIVLASFGAIFTEFLQMLNINWIKLNWIHDYSTTFTGTNQKNCSEPNQAPELIFIIYVPKLVQTMIIHEVHVKVMMNKSYHLQ